MQIRSLNYPFRVNCFQPFRTQKKKHLRISFSHYFISHLLEQPLPSTSYCGEAVRVAVKERNMLSHSSEVYKFQTQMSAGLCCQLLVVARNPCHSLADRGITLISASSVTWCSFSLWVCLRTSHSL